MKKKELIEGWGLFRKIKRMGVINYNVFIQKNIFRALLSLLNLDIA